MTEREQMAARLWAVHHKTDPARFETNEPSKEYWRRQADAALAYAAERERAAVERIIAGLEAEAEVLPCAEDAGVTRENALLIRADFSYEELDRLKSEALAAPPPPTTG